MVPGQGVAQELHDRGAAGKGVLAVAVGRGGVLGEALRHLVPALLVEAPTVGVLQPLDGFDLLQVDHGAPPARTV